MLECLVALCVALALALTPTDVEGQGSLALDRLTVPKDRLVPGCGLSPSNSVPLGPTQMRSGLWAGQPITSNPWSGDDRSIVAAIRERVVEAPRLPDGPPLSRAKLLRFRLQLADDVEQAYAAIYADAGPYLITVHAVTFNEAAEPDALRTRGTPRGRLFIPDRTIAVVSGVGASFEAVATYVREVATP
jgi:hypothetical protein